MDIDEIQSRINETNYWDVKILDFQVSYFGDEAILYINSTPDSCWRIIFRGCYKLYYETDAVNRDPPYVRPMNRAQLGYYGQNISVFQHETSLLKAKINLFLMEIEIICKEISVQKMRRSDIHFFWEDNGKLRNKGLDSVPPSSMNSSNKNGQ